MMNSAMQTPRPSMVINADDYAISKQVSLGIVDAFSRGIITSTSVVVNMPCFTEMGKVIRETSFDYGLHLNLTTGETLAGADLPLNQAGQSGIWRPMILAAFKGVGRDRLEREISAQFEKFQDFFGKNPSHVDSHHHIHMLPPIWALVRRKMLEFKIPFLRNSVDFIDKRSVKNMLLKLCAASNSLEGLVELPFTGHELLGMQRKSAVPAVPADTATLEWMVHCGYSDPQLRQYDSYVEPREAELSFLKRPEIQAELREKFRLVSFAQMKPL